MPHLFAYFDESGKHASHPIVAFTGLVASFERWRTFQERWIQLLRQHQINGLHASEAVRHSRPYGTMQAGTAEQRCADILPFVHEIIEGADLGVYVAVDVAAYKNTNPVLHRDYGADPHYFAFFMAINMMLGYFEIPRQATIGLILDDEQEKSIQCYRLLTRMKNANPEVKARVPSITFQDDQLAAPLQASDLFAYVTRSESEYRFTKKQYAYRRLYEEFQKISPASSNHLHFHGGFFDGPALQDWCHKHLAAIREAETQTKAPNTQTAVAGADEAASAPERTLAKTPARFRVRKSRG